MNESTIAELNKTASDLVGVLSGFTEQEFNTFPGPEKWSAGQMSQHVLKAVSSFDQILTAPSTKSERAPDEKIPILKSIFLDFTTKLKSPEFILPDQQVFEKDDLIKSLGKEFESIAAAAGNTDLTERQGFEIPGIGEMTKLEAVHFVIVHTQRHIHQAKNIYEQVQTLN